MKNSFRLFCLVVGLGLGCAADQVTLSNGDRVTGKVVKLEAGKLTVETEYAGAIQIDWERVSRMQAEERVLAESALGLVGVREIEREGEELHLINDAGEPFEMAAAELKVLRNSQEQHAYEAALDPGLLHAWQGELTLGFALARGNSETTNLSTGLNGARQTLDDKLSYYGTSVYATDRITSTVTANAIRGGLRYDRDFKRSWFGFGSADFEFNELQGLDLRSISGAGFGWHTIRGENTTLDVLGGMAWTREEYSLDPRRDFLSGKLGEEFSARLWPGTQLRQSGYYYPDLNDSSQYRFAFDLGLSSRINSWLSWQTAVSERYVSNPPLGSLRNDILVTTGLGVTLGKRK
jgi:hypothetical protein